MLSFIDCAEDHDRFQAVRLPVPVDHLEAASIVKLWSVPVNHLFYRINGDDDLYACCVNTSSSSVSVKPSKITLSAPLSNILSIKSNHVFLFFDDGSIRTLQFAPAEGWVEGMNFQLQVSSTSSVEYASSCASSSLYLVQRSTQFPDEVAYSLWKCSVSLESDHVSSTQCLAHKLPAFQLYVLRHSAIIIPSLPHPPDIYFSFGDANKLVMGSLTKRAVLFRATLSSPLDVAAFYRRRIWFWQVQTRAEVVLHGCVSPLASCLYLLLKDSSVIVLDSSGEVVRRVVLQDAPSGVQACCIVASSFCLFEDSRVGLYDLTEGRLLGRLSLQGTFRAVLPGIWAFWTTEGAYQLLGASARRRNRHSQLQSEALVYAARHAGAETLPGLPTDAQVKTKLNRILHPLVECYWKLQLTKLVLTS